MITIVWRNSGWGVACVGFLGVDLWISVKDLKRFLA